MGPLELTEVPFFPDDKTLCGPSALATVLGHAGANVSVEEAADQVYLPGRKGSLQAEMLGGIRRQGLMPLALPGEPEALIEAIRAGYPVLVLQQLRRLWLTRWHYAVVVGYRSETDAFVLRSGREERKHMPMAEFMASWAPAEHWAYVAIDSNTLPEIATAETYLQGAIGLESAGQFALAGQAFALGMQRWPEEPLFGFGMANALLQANRPVRAVDAYRQVLTAHPNHVASRNNLAFLLHSLGCTDAARRQLEQALAIPDLDPVSQQLLEQTQGQIADIDPVPNCLVEEVD